MRSKPVKIWITKIVSFFLFADPVDDGRINFRVGNDQLTLDDLAWHYRLHAEKYDLDPILLLHSFVKYVYMHRYEPLKLECMFVDLSDHQKQQIGETVIECEMCA